MHPTVISSWVLLIAKAIDAYQLDREQLFGQAGLDTSMLQDPNARYSYFRVTRLWNLATKASGDDGFGLTAAEFWHPTTLHALGYAWLASDTLQEALRRVVRYSQIVNTGVTRGLQVQCNETTTELILDTSEFSPAPAMQAVDANLATLDRMCRTICGAEFRAIEVCLQRPRPSTAKRFEAWFRTRLKFSQPDNRIVIDRTEADRPLATANTELARASDEILARHLSQLDQADTIMQVRARLIERLAAGEVSEAAIARSMNLSQRSLQRRLREQGASFKSLVEQTRRELSVQYVRSGQYSLNEITYLLGFSEASNFSRAFKRWYGSCPSEYKAKAACVGQSSVN